MTRRARIGIAITGIFALLAFVGLHERLVFLMSAPTIERYLVGKTPLGSTETEVLTSLRRRGVSAQPWHGHIQPSPPNDYPLTKVGGKGFIHESIGHYRLVFRTDVEAFYIFDGSGKLVDLRVRKSVDAP